MRIWLVLAFTFGTGVAQAESIQLPQIPEPVARPPKVATPTSTLSVGPFNGRLEHSTITVEEDPEGGFRATWTIEISTRSKTLREVVIPLGVSPDVAVTAMSLSLNSETLVGETLESHEARRTYETIVETCDDPALLEWVSAKDHPLRLRVFPMQKGSPATVTIELWLPGGTQLVLEPGSHRHVRRQTSTLAASGANERMRSVSREKSLLARFPAPYDEEGTKVVFEENPRTLGSGFHERVVTIPTSNVYSVSRNATRSETSESESFVAAADMP